MTCPDTRASDSRPLPQTYPYCALSGLPGSGARRFSVGHVARATGRLLLLWAAMLAFALPGAPCWAESNSTADPVLLGQRLRALEGALRAAARYRLRHHARRRLDRDHRARRLQLRHERCRTARPTTRRARPSPSRFYQTHGDFYDFIVVFTNFAFETGDAQAFHSLVRNDVARHRPARRRQRSPVRQPGPPQGLRRHGGRGPVAPPGGAYSLQPGDPGFQTTRERARARGGPPVARRRRATGTAPGQVSSDLLGLDGAHWSYLLDSDASVMYGSDWVPQATGVFRAARVRARYSRARPLPDGLARRRDSVPPFTLLRNPAVDPRRLPVEDATVTTPRRGDGHHRAGGRGDGAARARPSRLARRTSALGFVFLDRARHRARPGGPRLRRPHAEHFASRISSRSRAASRSPTPRWPRQPPARPAARARPGRRAGLAARAAGAGRALGGRARPPRCATRRPRSRRSRERRPADVGYAARPGAGSAAAEVANVDFLARRARALAPVAAPAERARARGTRCLAAQNRGRRLRRRPPATRATPSTPRSRWRALREPAGSPRTRASGAAFARARRARSDPAGGWALVPGREASTVATALVLSRAAGLGRRARGRRRCCAPGLAALLARQNEDGGFGESPSTAHGTALALLALDRSGAPGPVIDDAIAWLQAHAGDRTAAGTSRVRDGARDQGPQGPHGAEPGAAPGRPDARARARGRGRDRHASARASATTAAARVHGEPAPPVRRRARVPRTRWARRRCPRSSPGADALVTVRSTRRDRAGDARALRRWPIPTGRYRRSREDDNAASRSLVVEGPQPDLSVVGRRHRRLAVSARGRRDGRRSRSRVRNRGEREAPAERGPRRAGVRHARPPPSVTRRSPAARASAQPATVEHACGPPRPCPGRTR